MIDKSGPGKIHEVILVLLSPPICRSLVMTVWLSIAQSQFSSNFVSQRSANS